MTLANLCSMFDSYYIAAHRTELDHKYIASSELIYSDGIFKHHVDKDGYIVIKQVQDADYLIYIDQSGNICIWIYQNTLESKYKEIIDTCNKIRDLTKMHRHSTEARVTENKSITVDHKDESEDDEIIKSSPVEVININTFRCTECESRKFDVKILNSGAFKYKCKKCKTIFKLVPSKYYIISSKTIISNTDLNGLSSYLVNINEEPLDEEEEENGSDQN